MKKAIGILLMGFALVSLSIETNAQNVLDGVYVKEHIPTKKVVQYTHLREADVMWEKRIWRVIDNREKINFPLYYPLDPLTDRWSLWDIIRHHLTKDVGSLTPYKDFNEATLSEFGGDQFLYPVLPTDPKYLEQLSDMINILGPVPTDPIKVDDGFGGVRDSCKGYDANGNCDPAYPPRDTVKIESKHIVAWELKEDWFFDKQRSVLDVRIIGIAPIVQNIDPSTNQVTGHRRLMWLYFPELRYILQNYFVYNRMNDAMRLSFDDLFWKRQFNSYIKKESNIYDRKITDYTSGVDALLESEKIKQDMFEMEHDVWDL